MFTKAYIDPATGSYLITVVTAVVVTCSVVVGIFWRKIIGFFGGLKMKMLENKLKKQAGGE